jgi:CheY-like chemotaxis protein
VKLLEKPLEEDCSLTPGDALKGRCEKLTVLLVDDEETLLALGEMMLEALGLRVFTAGDGASALQIYKDNRRLISCVLLDLSMPQMDGAATFNELRTIDPEAKIILTTGSSEFEIEDKFVGKNLSGVLQKPYSLDALRDVINNVISGKDCRL